VWAFPDTKLGVGEEEEEEEERRESIVGTRETERKGGQRNVTVVGRFEF